MCVYVCTSGSSTQVPNFPMGFHLSLHDHQSHVHIVVSKGAAKIKPPSFVLLMAVITRNWMRSQVKLCLLSNRLFVCGKLCHWETGKGQTSVLKIQHKKDEPLGVKKKMPGNLPSNSIWSWWFKIKLSWGVDPGMCGISASNRQDVEKWRRRKSAA